MPNRGPPRRCSAGADDLKNGAGGLTATEAGAFACRNVVHLRPGFDKLMANGRDQVTSLSKRKLKYGAVSAAITATNRLVRRKISPVVSVAGTYHKIMPGRNSPAAATQLRNVNQIR